MEKQVNDYEQLKQAFENKYQSNQDYSNEIMALAKMVSLSVLRTVIDPQRKTAVNHSNISNSGYSANLVAMKNDICYQLNNYYVMETLSNGTTTVYEKNGDIKKVVDSDTKKAVQKMLEPFGDGVDLYQQCIQYILDIMDIQDHNTATLDYNWNSEELSKKVYIKDCTSKAVKTVNHIAIVEVYKALRRYIEQSRAINNHSVYSYDYINENADEVDRLYYRAGKYSTIINNNGTCSLEQYKTIEELCKDINLTPRQKIVLEYRLQGYGSKAIATKLGVSYQAIQCTQKAIQEKCTAIGFIPKK